MKFYNKALYPFTSKWIDIDSNKIHYIDEGTGAVILFSHAALSSSFMYRDIIKRLRRQYRCIAIDFPGFGLSTESENYDVGIEAQSNILEKFIIRLALNDIYGLGHDTGGPSLFGTAIRQTHLFKGLILTDTVIFPISEYAKLRRTLNVIGSGFFSWFNSTTNFLVFGTYNFGIRTRKLSIREKSQYYELFDTRHKRKLITKMLYDLRANESFMQFIKHGFETILNEKSTLIIYGENDPLTHLDIPSRIHGLLKNAQLFYINKEGHFPHEGQPEQMSNLIHHWIEDIENNVPQ